MKAWFSDSGDICVAAENNAERFALRWHQSQDRRAGEMGIVIYEQEPVDPVMAANDGDKTTLEKH